MIPIRHGCVKGNTFKEEKIDKIYLMHHNENKDIVFKDIIDCYEDEKKTKEDVKKKLIQYFKKKFPPNEMRKD